MKKFAFLLCFLITLSCSKDKNDALIPPDKFKEILVDLHIVDGYYMMNYSRIINHNDSVNFYNAIIQKHGYSRATFDSTLKYYTHESKVFDKLYDNVVTELNKLQQEISLLQQYEADSSRNLYKKKQQWNLPKDGPREMIPFKVAIKDSGLYSIVLRLKVFDDDESENLRLTAYFWNDSLKKGQIIKYFPTIQYKKTNRLVVLSTYERVSSPKATHIKGYILNHDNKDLNFKKHVEITSIIVAKE